jgi:uncharacterized circularly permuted ATP-grasp superfamily protein
MEDNGKALNGGLFDGYVTDGAYDEVFSAPGQPRAHYRPLVDRLSALSAEDWRVRQQTADLSFLRQGITFNVYRGEEGTERVFPFDLVPRILSRRKWLKIEAGLSQRLRALNAFVHDVYHDQRILRQGIIRADLVLGTSGYLPEFRYCDVPNDVYIHVAGIDLVRDAEGEVLVLEDNLRCPSGVSYVLENRRVMKHVLPQLFEPYHVRTIDDYPQRLREVLEYAAPPTRRSEPTIVV